MVDLRRLRAVLDRIGAATTQLRRLAAMSDDELRADPERMPGVKYRLRTPRGSANLLVHQYGDVDDRRVREILRTRIEDLEQFRTAIARMATET